MTTVGVIILGNSGVGKSLLANVLLGREAFQHETQARAVTTKTEYAQCEINGTKYAVYNIPGLIELNQDRIERNKGEIDRAFKQHPYAVILYVFGTGRGGRVDVNDVIAFNAINKAYPFSEKSVVFIVNQIPTDRKSNYESETKEALEKETEIPVKYCCFFTTIDKSSTTEKQRIQTKLVDTITSALPKTHTKKQEINLLLTELPKLRKQIDDLQKQIEEDRRNAQQYRPSSTSVEYVPILIRDFATTSISDNRYSQTPASRTPYGGRSTGEYMCTTGSANRREIFIGPRGGEFYVAESGNRCYIKK